MHGIIAQNRLIRTTNTISKPLRKRCPPETRIPASAPWIAQATICNKYLLETEKQKKKNIQQEHPN